MSAPAAETAPGHPEIARIVAPNPGPMTLEGTNTYLVGEGPVYVIDPGPADEGHIAAIRAEAEARGGIEGVLLTHDHLDHSDGVEPLGAPLLSGERIGPLLVLPTPGHSPDHVCLLLDGVCFSGDLVLGEGSSYVPPDGGSLVAYLESLRRLSQLELELICPGHGPWVTDPAAKIAEYRDHRIDRERKLLAALERGERSRAALLAAAWDDVPPELRPAAAQVMQAHLEKLETEDRLPPDLRP
jgi:glyoxylase-like metal-dependent hydrolase (beta-lactamase superfamily II)